MRPSWGSGVCDWQSGCLEGWLDIRQYPWVCWVQPRMGLQCSLRLLLQTAGLPEKLTRFAVPFAKLPLGWLGQRNSGNSAPFIHCPLSLSWCSAVGNTEMQKTVETSGAGPRGGVAGGRGGGWRETPKTQDFYFQAELWVTQKKPSCYKAGLKRWLKYNKRPFKCMVELARKEGKPPRIKTKTELKTRAGIMRAKLVLCWAGTGREGAVEPATWDWVWQPPWGQEIRLWASQSQEL